MEEARRGVQYRRVRRDNLPRARTVAGDRWRALVRDAVEAYQAGQRSARAGDAVEIYDLKGRSAKQVRQGLQAFLKRHSDAVPAGLAVRCSVRTQERRVFVFVVPRTEEAAAEEADDGA